MPKPPHDPGSGPRIRARARGGSSSIRPEVADALGGVERSLSEVAKWEQMLAGRAEGGGPVIPALPEGYVGLASEELAPPVEEPVVEEPAEDIAIEVAEDPEVREIGILDAVRAAEEEGAEDTDEDTEPQDAAAAADALVAPLLTEFRPDDVVEEDTDESVLWAARTVEDPVSEVSAETIAKRRRHARILSWAGALILIAGAALWLVPDRSGDDDDQLPAIDVTSTTRSDTNLLDDTDTTVPTTATTATTTPSTTETTRRATATTVRRAPATTQATSPPTTAASGSTLPLPGPPGTVNPSRTVPTAPPTTAAPTTTAPTTTAPANGVPLI